MPGENAVNITFLESVTVQQEALARTDELTVNHSI